jgi:inward rectifier potassium channel
MACGDCIENAKPGSFLDPFFFSIQTIATIGYGQLVPRTVLANILVAIEAIFGLLGFGIVAGLAYAKFSRPTARVLFSRVAVITQRDGQLSLMFRMGNERGNRIVDAQVHLSMLRDETTLEGEPIRRVYDLDLVRDRNANFQNSWTAVHPITEKSPLHGATPEKLTSANPQIVVSLTGLDETFSQTVYARHTYTCDNILSGHRFVDVLSVTPDGIPQIDYTRFHDTVPVDARKYAGTRSAKNV